jgi:hypothetical protein
MTQPEMFHTANIWKPINALLRMIQNENIIIIIKTYSPSKDAFVYTPKMILNLHPDRREIDGGRIVAYMVLDVERVARGIAQDIATEHAESIEFAQSQEADLIDFRHLTS